jgi:ADP-dependent NAD(P)H-hydrate dehydratase
VLVIAGGKEVPGAALLAGIAALRGGAGRLQIATHEANAGMMAVAIPEARVLGLPEPTDINDVSPALEQLGGLVEKADAVLLGPGLTNDRSTSLLSRLVLNAATDARVLFDALALKTLRLHTTTEVGGHRRVSAMTPHAGEMAGLAGVERHEVEADMTGFARRAANGLGTVVALEGARTIICENDDCVSCDGHVGLATSGSGDVLAGLIAGLLARGAPPFSAVCWGVYAHAQVGLRLAEKVGPLGFIARELLDEIPRVLAHIHSSIGETHGKTQNCKANAPT